MKKALLILFIITVVGCTSNLRPPAEYFFKTKSPMKKLWVTSLSCLQEAGYSIKNADKDSGFIASENHVRGSAYSFIGSSVSVSFAEEEDGVVKVMVGGSFSYAGGMYQESQSKNQLHEAKTYIKDCIQSRVQ